MGTSWLLLTALGVCGLGALLFFVASSSNAENRRDAQDELDKVLATIASEKRVDTDRLAAMRAEHNRLQGQVDVDFEALEKPFTEERARHRRARNELEEVGARQAALERQLGDLTKLAQDRNFEIERLRADLDNYAPAPPVAVEEPPPLTAQPPAAPPKPSSQQLIEDTLRRFGRILDAHDLRVRPDSDAPSILADGFFIRDVATEALSGPRDALSQIYENVRLTCLEMQQPEITTRMQLKKLDGQRWESATYKVLTDMKTKLEEAMK